MAKEYIERESLKKRLACSPIFMRIRDISFPMKDAVLDLVERQPTADVVEVVYGEWIPIEHEYRNKFERVMIADEFDCGICGRRLGYRANYCPNCGAKMEGKEKQNG